MRRFYTPNSINSDLFKSIQIIANADEDNAIDVYIYLFFFYCKNYLNIIVLVLIKIQQLLWCTT